MKRIVTLIALMLMSYVGQAQQAQQTVFVPICVGDATLDTSKFIALKAAIGATNTGTIKIPYISNPSQRCKLNTFSTGTNITLDNTDGSGIFVVTGQTVTLGPVINPPEKQIFYNALSGQGTVSISTKAVYPEWWGAVGDGLTNSTAALQAAITSASGRPVALMAGTYVVTSPLTYRISATAAPGLQLIGAGMYKTIFDNRVANGAMLSLSAQSNYQFAYGTRLSDFSIVTTTAPSNSDGISIRSQWHATIDYVRVHGLSGKAITGVVAGDPDSNSFVEISHCTLTNNAHGLYMDNNTQPGWNHIYVRHSHIQLNAGYGVGILGGETIHIETCSIGDNNYGVFIDNGDPGANAPRNIRVYGNEFQSNITNQIYINSGYNVTLEHNSDKADDISHAFRPLVSVVVAPGSATTENVVLRSHIHRVINPTSYTAYSIGSSNANNTRIESPLFLVFPAPSVKYIDNGTRTTIIEANQSLRALDLYASTNVTAPATYTPDTLSATFHRVIVTAGSGTLTIGPATGLSAGRGLALEVLNSTGGTINVVWNAAFAFPRGSIYYVAAGERLAVLFRADSGAWVPMGVPFARARAYTGSGNWAPRGALPAQTSATFNITVAGAVVGSAVDASPDGDLGASFVWSARVSAPDTVTVIVANVTTAPATPSTRKWQATVTVP